MTSSLRYASVGTAVVAAAVVLSWPFLDPAGRRGVVMAALIALPVQIASFAVLLRYRGEVKGFLGAWVGGPRDESGGASAAIFGAAQRLRDRFATTSSLPAQHRLLLLRLCFAPQLAHLVRTTHPDAAVAGCRQFDTVSANAVASLRVMSRASRSGRGPWSSRSARVSPSTYSMTRK